MASLRYTGSFSSTSNISMVTARSMTPSSSSSAPGGVSAGYLYVGIRCSTTNASKDYTVQAVVRAGGVNYIGSAECVFNSSGETSGKNFSIQIYASSSFDINDVTQVTVSELNGNGGSLYLRTSYDHYVDVPYVMPTAPTVPFAVTLDGVAGDAYMAAGGSAVLAWSGAAAGSYNAITGYKVYRNGSLYQSISTGVTSGSLSVPAHSTAGNTYEYTVVTAGVHSDSGASTGRSIYSYGVPSAPGTVTVNNSTPDTGVDVTLSWNGAVGGGVYNPIIGYRIYRAPAETGVYSLLQTVSSNATSGSCAVTAPATMGSTYNYKIITACERQSSDYSSNTASVTAKTYTACTAPTTVKLNNAAENLYVVAGTNITLAWSGAAGGINNAISGYDIYQNGVLYDSVSSSTSSKSVPMQSTAGQSYSYTVVAKGAAGSAFYSPASVARIVYTITAPTAPSTVTLDGNTSAYALPGATAILAWSGAAGGTLNAISGYKIYQGNVLYTTVSASATSCSVPAHSEAGSSYAYTVVAAGAHSDSIKSVARTIYSYSAPTAPTIIVLDDATPDAGDTVRLSWSNASAGDYNSVVGYEIYRAASATGMYTKIATVTSSSTSGSTNVAAPTTMNASYYFKLLVLGARSNSAMSSAYASMTTMVYTDCTPPSTVTIGGGTAAYAAPGGTVTLTWSDAAGGTNNAIISYKIYRGASLAHEVGADVSSYSVAAHSSAGGSYTYTVVSVGEVSSSVASAARTVYSYGSPSAPSAVNASNATPDAGAEVALSWSGASAGSYNTIIGYDVYRATSESGTYEIIKTVNATATSGTALVTAPATMGASYYYKLRTRGSRGNSSQSSAVAHVTAKVYTACSAPTSVSLSRSIANPGDTSVLSWSGAVGGTNASVSGYEVYRATAVDGAYTLLATVNATNLSVNAHATQGSTYFYKIKTLSSPVGFESELSSAHAGLLTNTYPNAPIINAPSAANRVTYNPRPRILATVAGDPNNVSQTVAAAGYAISTTGGQVIGKKLLLQKTTALATAGAQSVNVVSSDSLGGASDPAVASFAYDVAQYTDADIVVGLTPIRAAHINELRAALDNVCDYYGIARTAWATTVTAGVTSTLGWVSHITEIQDTIKRVANYVNNWDEATGSLDITLPAFLTARSPTASVVMQLREIIKIL